MPAAPPEQGMSLTHWAETQWMQPTECLCADAGVSELVFVLCPHRLLHVFQQRVCHLSNAILAQFKNC